MKVIFHLIILSITINLFGDEILVGNEYYSGKYDYADPSSHTLPLVPTAFTNPEGTWYFSDRELLFLDYGKAITANTQLAAGCLFPVSTEFNAFTFGIKQNVLQHRNGPLSAALFLNGSIILSEEDGNNSVLSPGGILTYGNLDNNLTTALMYSKTEDSDIMIFALGGCLRSFKQTKFTAEFIYFHGRNQKQDEDDIEDNILNVGIRFFGKTMSFDICGFRPLRSTGSMLLIPYVQYKYHF